jgi:putative oxidoreductase
VRTELGASGTARVAGTALALLLLRAILAAVFGVHGYLKWAGGLGPLAGLMMSVHLPFPDQLARVSATLELGGGILLLIGLWTRLVGALLAIEMAVAIVKIVLPHGFIGGFEFELTLLAAALALAIAGGGTLSVGRDRLSR